MNFFEKIENWFIDQFIKSWLYKRVKAHNNVFHICCRICSKLKRNILNLILMPNSPSVPSWKNNIQGMLNLVLECHTKSNILSSSYEDWLISGNNEQDIKRFIEIFIKQISIENIPNTILQDYEKIMKQICIDLGNGECNIYKRLENM